MTVSGPEGFTDKQVLRWAVLMWRNHVETGNVHLSAVDAANCGEQEKIKPLDHNQKAFVVRLEELAARISE